MTQVFISYSRKDLAFIERLANDLQAHGLQVWFDLSGLEVGTRWGKEIQHAIQQSQYFLVVLSPNSIESEWVEKEFLYANSLKQKIIPILYKPCSLPMWFINLHFIDMQGKNYKLHFTVLLKALGIQPGEKMEELKPAVEDSLMQPGSQKSFPQMVGAESEKPPPQPVQLPVERRPAVEKILQPDKPTRKEPMQARRKIKLRPEWIILLAGLAAVAAFMIWGMPPLANMLARTLEKLTTLGQTPGGLTALAPTTGVAATIAPAKVTIIIGTTDTLTSLDPADSYNAVDMQLIKNTSAGLLGLKPGTSELEPVLAEDQPEITADGLTYTMRLRPGIKFADGLILTAPLYAQQLNRLLTIGPICPNQVANILAIPYVESITAPDDATLVFKLKNPAAFFSQILAMAAYGPSHPDTFPLDNCVLFPTAPIYGVGPWFISQYTQAEQVVLEPNPYYTGPYPAQVERVILRFFGDPQALAQAVKIGEIDIAWPLRGSEQELLAQLEGASGVTVGATPGGLNLFLFINHAVTAMDDENVAKAIASSIDRKAITDGVYKGFATPLYSIIPPGLLGATEAFDGMYAAPNLDKAKQYLLASGYTETNKLVVELWYSPERHGALATTWMELIKQQLEATNAITANLHTQDWSKYIQVLGSGNLYPVGVQGWFMDYPDPANFIDPFTYNGGMGNNITIPQEDSQFGVPQNNKVQQLVDLLSRADEETDLVARAKLYQQAQELYADLVVNIPLFFENDHIIYRDNIHASSRYAAPESLNIGPAPVFNYSLLTKGP
jgi:peptide/nickel transport system substrate-binding protein